MPTVFCKENINVRKLLERLGVNGRIIFNWIFKTILKAVAWTHLKQVRDDWLVVVTTVSKQRKKYFD
jgi:hypothetical protein